MGTLEAISPARQSIFAAFLADAKVILGRIDVIKEMLSARQVCQFRKLNPARRNGL